MSPSRGKRSSQLSFDFSEAGLLRQCGDIADGDGFALRYHIDEREAANHFGQVLPPLMADFVDVAVAPIGRRALQRSNGKANRHREPTYAAREISDVQCTAGSAPRRHRRHLFLRQLGFTTDWKCTVRNLHFLPTAQVCPARGSLARSRRLRARCEIAGVFWQAPTHAGIGCDELAS